MSDIQRGDERRETADREQALRRPKHKYSDCDREILMVRWKTGCPTDGHIWTCSCGREWVFVEDEAEGGFWVDARNQHHQRPNNQPNKRKGEK